MLDKLCMPETPCRLNTVLTTTKWGQGRADSERQREQALSSCYTAHRIPRFLGNRASAWHVVDVVLRLSPVSVGSVRDTFYVIAEKSSPRARIILGDMLGYLFS
jgi:hypothetical protein